jgi:hypothetical protein
LDLDTGTLNTLAEQEAMIWSARNSIQPLRSTTFAARMNPDSARQATLQAFNSFSMRYTGKPLVTRGGAAARRDPRLPSFPGHSGIEEAKCPDSPPETPSSWELVRRKANGSTQVLATGVLYYDLAPDGSVVFSNGGAVDYLPAGTGKAERLFSGRWIELVAVI